MVTKILYISEYEEEILKDYISNEIVVSYYNYVNFDKINIHLDTDNRSKKDLNNYKEKILKYDVILIDNISKVSIVGLDILTKIADPYRILVNEKKYNISTVEINNFIKRFKVRKFNFDNKDYLCKILNKSFFKKHYGERINVQELQVTNNFIGSIEFHGKSYLELTGDFGSDFSQVAYFCFNRPQKNNIVIELWPEFQKDDSVKIQYRVQSILSGSVDEIINEQIFSEKDLEDNIYIENEHDCYLFISIFAKGSGSLKLGHTHYRLSRNELGILTLGGEVIRDRRRQELLVYFEPGDMKPPLNIYFSGIRFAEGFEGYAMLKDLESPFMLISDPRLDGGAFYFGSEELEEKLLNKINENMQYLGFNKNQIIMSGLSMGTFGALYYGARIEPHAIIIGKPLASIGTIAKNQRFLAPDVFPTSLDIVRYNVGELSIEATNKLDDRFWSLFNNAKLDNTKIVSSYMLDDDYDRTAHYDIVESLKNKKAVVIGKGFSGRHNDNSSAIIFWFLEQYKNILENDFGREKYEK